MNKLLGCLIVLLLSQSVFAQKEHFVYLQSDGGRPFFVRMGEHTYNSSSKGYLILSKMRDSSYTFRVGWPGKTDEQVYFTMPVSGRDRGLLLKHFEQEGWGLFDLQTLEVVRSHGAPNTNSSVKYEPRQVSNFTDVLAKAANDPTLRMKEVRVVELPKEEKAVAVAVPKTPETAKEETTPSQTISAAEDRKDSAALVLETTKPESQEDPLVETLAKSADSATAKKEIPGVKEIESEAKIDSAIARQEASGKVQEADTKNIDPPVAKVDITETENKVPPTGKSDTVVKTEVPVAKVDTPAVKDVKEAVGESNAGAVGTKPESSKDNGAVVISDIIYAPSKVSRRSESSTTEGFSMTFIDEYPNGDRDTIRILIPSDLKPWQKEPAKQPVAEEKKFLDIPVSAGDAASTAKVKVNNCKQKAVDADYQRLRKKMQSAANSDDRMIREARSAFEQKCYTVRQVRNLGALFQNDAAKFQFFEAACDYVSDAENLPLLEIDLKNEYYLRRFKQVLEARQ